jgi:hypothetical protein
MKFFNDSYTNIKYFNDLFKLIILVILSVSLIILINNSQNTEEENEEENEEKDLNKNVEPFSSDGKNVYANICATKPTQFYNIRGNFNKITKTNSSLESCKNKCLTTNNGCDIYTLNNLNSDNRCNIYTFSNSDNFDVSINCNENIIQEYRDKYEGIGYINKNFYKKEKNGIKYDDYLLNKSEEIIKDYNDIDNQIDLINNLDYTDPQQYSINIQREKNKLKDMYDSSSISVSNKLNSIGEFLNLNQNKIYSDFIKEHGLANKFAAKQNDIKLIPESETEFYTLDLNNEYKINVNQNTNLNKQNIIGYKIIAQDNVTENTNVNFKISYKNDANEFQLLDERYPGTENSLIGSHIDRNVYFNIPIKTHELKIQPVTPSSNNNLEQNKYISFKLKLIVDNNLVNLGENNITYYEMLKAFDEQYQKKINDEAKLEDNKKNITSGKLLYLILSIILVLTLSLIFLYKTAPEFISTRILFSYFVIVIILLYLFNHYIT